MSCSTVWFDPITTPMVALFFWRVAGHHKGTLFGNHRKLLLGMSDWSSGNGRQMPAMQLDLLVMCTSVPVSDETAGPYMQLYFSS